MGGRNLSNDHGAGKRPCRQQRNQKIRGLKLPLNEVVPRSASRNRGVDEDLMILPKSASDFLRNVFVRLLVGIADEYPCHSYKVSRITADFQKRCGMRKPAASAYEVGKIKPCKSKIAYLLSLALRPGLDSLRPSPFPIAARRSPCW